MKKRRKKVRNLMDMLNEITPVKGKEIKSGQTENKWTGLSAEIRTRRYKWVTVCHRVLIQQDHLLCEDQLQRVEPVKKEDKNRSNMKSLKELVKVAVLKLKLLEDEYRK